MTTVTDYLNQLQSLTQTNLEILQAINDSFFTKREHITVNVDTGEYKIPSFLYLENKVNALQENFTNLVKAPTTGEAFFNFDGNSQAIELKRFTCTPESVSLAVPERFDVEQNDVFKDFLTPNPYIKFNLSSIPDDIPSVCVKKIAAISDSMKSLFKSLITDSTTGAQITYADMYKKQVLYTEDVDYVEYDTIRQLPIRKNIGTGEYIIKSIDSENIDSDLIETYKLTFSGEDPLKYTLFDGTIEKYLQIGDYLTTYDGEAKLLITEVNHNTSQLTLRVLNGSYVNFVADVGDEDIVSDYSKLKFFSPVDFDDDKYINVPLEEDNYVAIFVAPLNSRMNIQSPWGTGVVVNTYDLKNNQKPTESFWTYYNENVNNIGDTLKELTTIVTSNITSCTKSEFDKITTYIPELLSTNLSVVQINKHVNDASTIQNIRNLYSQKQQYKSNLEVVNGNIQSVEENLAKISFTDTSSIRTVYEEQLSKYNEQRNELVASINTVMNEIATTANSSEVPIENAKYHIRGFFDLNSVDITNVNGDAYKDHIKSIKVYYRYKGKDKDTGNAATINNHIYSDWNLMDCFDHNILPNCKSDNNYAFSYEEDTSNINVPSFNQLDIPISQGETVDIKLQIVWDYGFPYIHTTSAWSNIINIEFPQEFLKEVPILDIISENNDDIETNRFNNLLKTSGVETHINDKIIDQNITYFHQPENIASGFYTDEKRIIPLKDKLQSLNDDIKLLQDEIYGTSINNLTISVMIGDQETLIYPNQTNNVYYSIDTSSSPIIDLNLTNDSNRTIKLYPVVMGSRDVDLSDTSNYGAQILHVYKSDSTRYQYQKYNQYIYFRSTDVWRVDENGNKAKLTSCSYPYITSQYDLSVDSDSKFEYFVLNPADTDTIPIQLMTEGTIQFDIKTSLYQDPITYEIVFKKQTNSITSSSTSSTKKLRNKTTIVNTYTSKS